MKKIFFFNVLILNYVIAENFTDVGNCAFKDDKGN